MCSGDSARTRATEEIATEAFFLDTTNSSLNLLYQKAPFPAPLPPIITKGRPHPQPGGLVSLACCNKKSSSIISKPNQTGTLSPLPSSAQSPHFFHHLLLRVPEHPGYHPPRPHHWKGRRRVPSIHLRPHWTTEHPSRSGAVGTARGALTDAHSYPFSPERPHRAVQEEASARARETGARLGRRRVRMGPGAAAGCALELWEPGTAPLRPRLPGPDTWCLRRPARWDPGCGPSASAAAGPRTAWGEGQGPGRPGPVGGRGGGLLLRGRPTARAPDSVAQAPSRLRSGLVSRSRSGWGRRTAEAAASRPRRRPGQGREGARCAASFSRACGCPGSLRWSPPRALHSPGEKQYPVPAREMQTPEPRGVALVPLRMASPGENFLSRPQPAGGS